MSITTAPLGGRIAVFVYGVASYAVFFASFLYLAAFIGNLFVPVTLDAVPTVGLMQGLLTDLGLIGVFALQHSVMARPVFKRWLVTLIPPAAERSTYVLASSLALMLLFALWEPLGGTVWRLEGEPGRTIAWSVFGAGWLLVLVATFLINHFDLFGLRQVWLHLRGKPYTSLRFATPWLYRQVRHPLYVGWLMAFWATPTMTLTHLAFALAMTAYILVAIRFEERDLVAEHGESYRRYRERVPMLVPRLGARSAATSALGAR
jgi:protein-S-isoprenylcysteine O-methyltransferase Ste14